jgi:hypothetical protein
MEGWRFPSETYSQNNLTYEVYVEQLREVIPVSLYNACRKVRAGLPKLSMPGVDDWSLVKPTSTLI